MTSALTEASLTVPRAACYLLRYSFPLLCFIVFCYRYAWHPRAPATMAYVCRAQARNLLAIQLRNHGRTVHLGVSQTAPKAVQHRVEAYCVLLASGKC